MIAKAESSVQASGEVSDGHGTQSGVDRSACDYQILELRNVETLFLAFGSKGPTPVPTARLRDDRFMFRLNRAPHKETLMPIFFVTRGFCSASSGNARIRLDDATTTRLQRCE